MSKGSRPRPFSISQKDFGSNFDAIFRKPNPKDVDDAKAEDEAFSLIKEHPTEKEQDETKR